jgi:hypothetical protein
VKCAKKAFVIAAELVILVRYFYCQRPTRSKKVHYALDCFYYFYYSNCISIFTKTRLKRLPVISREHFRKTRTNYFFKHLFVKSKETKKCRHRDDDDDLVEFCHL